MTSSLWGSWGVTCWSRSCYFPAHTLWHSSKIKTAHFLSATLCWRAFYLPVETHWGHIQVKSKPLESTPNQWWMQSGWTNAPVPLPISCNNSVSQGDLAGRSPVAWVVSLLTHCYWLPSLLCLTSLLPTSVSWDHFQNKSLPFTSLSQGLLMGNPN